MKILYLSPSFPNGNQKAADVRANQLLKRLSSQVDLHVFGFCESLEHNGTGYDLQATIVNKSEMTLTGIVQSLFSAEPRAFLRYQSPMVCAALSRVLQEFRPDIVHFDSIGVLGLLGVVQSECPNARTVFHVHDSVTKIYSNGAGAERGLVGNLNSYFEGKKIKRIESQWYAKADLCLVDSQEDADFLCQLNPKNKVNVLPLGFDRELFSPVGWRQSLVSPNIVFSGAMNGSQSVDAVLFLLREIMPIIWNTLPDTTVYVVGSNPPVELLAFQGPRVVVTGFVEDLASYLRAADVYLSPMRIGSGMRTRMVEALACGCPVLATTMAMQGIWTDAMSGIRPWKVAGSAQEFATGYLSLMESPSVRTNLALKGYEFVDEWYSWETVTSHLVEYYKGIHG